jgi:hypothetical protein
LRIADALERDARPGRPQAQEEVQVEQAMRSMSGEVHVIASLDVPYAERATLSVTGMRPR